MAKDGFRFYCSENGVWLTKHVPPKYQGDFKSPDNKSRNTDYELSQVFCFLYAVRIITLKKTHP